MLDKNSYKFHKILVFPITETFLEQLQIQKVNFDKMDDRIIIRLDPDEWINFQMILKFKKYENQNMYKFPNLILFTRPLIKVFLSELLQILLDFKKKGFHLLDYNLEDVWIQYSIQHNLIDFKKLVVFCKTTKQNEKVCKIKQLIQPILNIFNSYNERIWIKQEPQDQINHIIGQIPFSDYEKQFQLNYQCSHLNKFKQQYLPKGDFTNIDDEILNNSFIYEFYYYSLPINELLLEDFKQKYQKIKQQVNQYLKKFEYILQYLSQGQQNQIGDQIERIIKKKIHIRRHANSVSQFTQLELKIKTFLGQQETFDILFNIIQEIDCQIIQFGLIIILNDILNQKFNSQYQQAYDKCLNELGDKVHKQLVDFYRQIRDHLSLNENIEQFIFQCLDIPFILNKLCLQLKMQYSEWHQDKDRLIKQAIINQQVMIKEEFFKAIEKYVKDL